MRIRTYRRGQLGCGRYGRRCCAVAGVALGAGLTAFGRLAFGQVLELIVEGISQSPVDFTFNVENTATKYQVATNFISSGRLDSNLRRGS